MISPATPVLSEVEGCGQGMPLSQKITLLRGHAVSPSFCLNWRAIDSKMVTMLRLAGRANTE